MSNAFDKFVSKAPFLSRHFSNFSFITSKERCPLWPYPHLYSEKTDSKNNNCLTHFESMFQGVFVFRGFRSGTLVENGLKINLSKTL